MNTAIFDLVPSGDVVVERCAPGAVLFSEGETPRGIFLLYSGQVDLIFRARNGNVKPLRVAGSGQVLGVSEVVSGIKHDCTATVRASCRVGFISGEAFRRALDQHPPLWFSVLSVLSRDVGAVYDDMRELAVG